MSFSTRCGWSAGAAGFLLIGLASCGRGSGSDFLLDSGVTPQVDAGSHGDGDSTGHPDAGHPHDAGHPPPKPDAHVGDGDGDAPKPDSGTPDAGHDAGPPADDGDWIVPEVPALAPRPPMGWNSWNKFGCNINETLIKGVADTMAANGMKDAGYEFVNLDDCWQTSRTDNGYIVADANQFPSGIKALADYVHSKGLKLGVYSDRGTKTCQGRPGSQGYETLDAQSYAGWGVDYLKYDNCNTSLDAATQYKTMQSALLAAGRPTVFSICYWSFAEFMPATGQLWRTTGDISDNWGSMTGILDVNARYAAYAHPGAWNDPDMLEVGNGGMTDSEYKAHFSVWAMMAAPLIAGNDLASMASTTKDILTNKEVIAIDQDPWGYQGHRIQSDNGLEVWFRPLAGVGQRAVLLFNRSDNAANLTAKWSDIGLAPGKASVRDVWLHLDRGEQTDEFTATVLKHDAVMLKISGQEPEPPHGTVSLSDLTWTYAANGWGAVEKDKSVHDLGDHDGNTLTIGGLTYTKGLGVHGASLIRYRLGGKCTRLRSDIGIDDEAGNDGSVVFRVLADGKSIYESTLMKKGSRSSIDLDVTGVRELKLSVDNGGDGATNDHADWANPVLDCVP